MSDAWLDANWKTKSFATEVIQLRKVCSAISPQTNDTDRLHLGWLSGSGQENDAGDVPKHVIDCVTESMISEATHTKAREKENSVAASQSKRHLKARFEQYQKQGLFRNMESVQPFYQQAEKRLTEEKERKSSAVATDDSVTLKDGLTEHYSQD